MKSVLITILILPVLFCFGQSTETTLKSSEKVMRLLDSAQKSIYTNPVSAINIAQECIPLIDANDYNFAKSYRIIGAGNYMIGDYSLSKQNYLNALNYDLKQEDSLNIIKDYRGVAINLGEQANYKSCYSYLDKALGIASKLNDLDEVIEIMNSKGVFYFHQKEYLKAVELHTQVLKMADSMDTIPNLTVTYSNLGAVYAEIGKLDLALDNLLKGQKLAQSGKNKYYEGSFSTNIAGIYSKQKKNELAITYYKESIEAFLEISYIKGLAYSSVSLAIIYLELENDVLFKEYAKNAFDYASLIDDKVVLSLYHNLMAKFLLDNKEYEKAIYSSKEALSLAKENGDILREKEALELLYQSYENQMNSKQALKYYKRFILLKDSLENKETIEKIENIELKRTLELSEKEREISAQKLLIQGKEQQSEKTKLYFTIVFISFFLILILLLYRIRVSKLKREKEIISKNESLEKAENKLSKLALEKEREQKDFLKKEVNFKNNRIKELANIINQKNELLDEFSSDDLFKESTRLTKKIKKLIDSKEERDLFNQEIKQIDANFHQKLLTKFPSLTKNDLKIASMLKMNLSSKEMASLLSISSTSVDVSRSRFRKKINLQKGDNLLTFFNEL